MKKLQNLGKALNKAEQKSTFGGFKKNDPNCDIMLCCGEDSDCPPDALGIGHFCNNGVCQLYYY